MGEEQERLEEEAWHPPLACLRHTEAYGGVADVSIPEAWHPPLVLPELPAECAGVLLAVYLQFTCFTSTKKYKC